MNENQSSVLHQVRQSVLVTLVLLVVCGLAFPLALSGLSAVFFPHQAKGSLVMADGKTVGAAHVGQEFTQACFMKGRPSAYHYNTYSEDAQGNLVYSDGSAFGGIASGSSNYGPSNPALQERVAADLDAILAANPGVEKKDIPTDLATASGSGLDPHISQASAELQLPAIAEASGLSLEELTKIVENNTEGKLLGVFGEETVNVLGVNLDIVQSMGMVESIEK